MIEFLCPNGHRVHCGDEQAGRAAKCPQCEVKFRVPELTNIQASRSAVSTPTDSARQPVAPAVPSTAEKASEIEFLCPAGHHLHGPASLQGRPGECPECGQRFYIPSFTNVPEEIDSQQELSLSRPQDDKGPEPTASPAGETTRAEEIENSEWPGTHPLCDLVCQLWARRPPGASIELHLSNGEILTPDRFARELSAQQYGMFAIREPGGTHTLTLVSWESIVRVEVRGVEQLPEEMTEDQAGRAAPAEK